MSTRMSVGVSKSCLYGQCLALTRQGAVDIARPLEAKGHDNETANIALSARQFWRGKKALGAQKEDVLPQPGPRFAEQIQENAEAG